MTTDRIPTPYRLRSGRRIFCILLVSALGSACHGGGGHDDVVATVDGTAIHAKEVDAAATTAALRLVPAGAKPSPSLVAELRRAALEDRIEEILFRAKAKALRIVVSPSELLSKVAEHKARFGDDRTFKAQLGRLSTSEAEVRRSIELQLLRERVFDKLAEGVSVSESELREHYDKHRSAFTRPAQVRLIRILTAPKGPVTSSLTSVREKLLAAKKALDIGSSTSDEGIERSSSPSDAASVQRMAMPNDEYQARFGATGKLQVGQVANQRQASGRSEMVMIEETQPPRIPDLMEVRTEIREEVLRAKRAEVRRHGIEALRKAARVQILQKTIEPREGASR